MIKTFLFDLGNVLVRFSHPRMHKQMAALLGLSAHEVEEILAKDRLQWRYEAGEVSTDELVECFALRARRPIDKAALMHAASDIFDPIEAMGPVTRRLKALGHRLVIVSNTNEAHVDFLKRRFDVFAPFDELILSYAVKAMKPDLAFYEAALVAARCEPAEALFTDDLLENVEGARRFGFATSHFSTPEAFSAELLNRGIKLD